jgi:hypothetical protein
MQPITVENFEPNNNPVVVVPVNQGAMDPELRQLNRNTDVLDFKLDLPDTLFPKNEIPPALPAEINLQSDDNKIKISEVKSDDIYRSSSVENDASSSKENLVVHEEKTIVYSSSTDMAQDDDTNIGQQTNDISTLGKEESIEGKIGEQTNDVGTSKVEILPAVEIENAKDPQIISLQQYRKQESIAKITEEFVKSLIVFVKDWMQFIALTISNDPTVISFLNHVKELLRMVEDSLQIVNDRLPSDSQPFVKGFLVGTLILNVINEGQRYKEGVYTMYADENGLSTKILNGTDVDVNNALIMSNETNVTMPQPWSEESEMNAAYTTSDEENDPVPGEVKALAEVLISKRIVKELLQKKTETQKPFFATSVDATSEKLNFPFPQPPLEKPPIHLFDTNLQMLLYSTNDNFSILNDSTEGGDIPLPRKVLGTRWASPFLRLSSSETKRKIDAPAVVKANGFISWMKNVTESLVRPPTTNILDSISETKPNLLDISNTQERPQRTPGTWSNLKPFGFTKDSSLDYDFVTPSAVDKIFDFGDPSYGTNFSPSIDSITMEISDDFDVVENPFLSSPDPIEKLSFGDFNKLPIQFNDERLRSDKPENERDVQKAPFNTPFNNNSAKSDTQWSPTVTRTTYSSSNESFSKKEEPKKVEFSSPFDSYESQYSRFGGNNPGFGNAGADVASTTPASMLEFTSPVEFKATSSALNIYSNEPTPVLDSKKEDVAGVRPPDQEMVGRSNNYEYPEQTPVSDTGSGNDQLKPFQFPAPPNYEPSFSALGIYNVEPASNDVVPVSNTDKLYSSFEVQSEIPPAGVPSFELKFQPQESVEATFSALSIYNVEPASNDVASISNNNNLYSSSKGQSDIPPAGDPSFESKFQPQESAEATFSALSIYSVEPVSNDVAPVSNNDKFSSSFAIQPNLNQQEMHGKAPFLNQDLATPVPIDSMSDSEPSFNLADLFNETVTMQDAETRFDALEAVTIPIADVLPPSFQVDIEVADTSQTNPYDKVTMFSILPDMNDIFSAKPSYNPYPTVQPEELKINDFRYDAIDTPVDSNPTYPEIVESSHILPQAMLSSSTLNKSSTIDSFFHDRETKEQEVSFPERAQSNGLGTGNETLPETTNQTFSCNDVDLEMPPHEVALPAISNEFTKIDPWSSEQNTTDNWVEPTLSSPADDALSSMNQFDSSILSDVVPKSEIPTTLQSFESSFDNVMEQNSTNHISNPIDNPLNGTEDLVSLKSSSNVETSNKSYSKNSTQPSTNQRCDDVNAEVLEQNDDRANDLNVQDDVDTPIDYNRTIRDESIVSFPESSNTENVSSSQQNYENVDNYDYIWDEEPFQ